jgi:4-hydroxybenzoate polyprenyltransferase
MHYLRVTRPLNLVMIALLMWVMYSYFLMPHFEVSPQSHSIYQPGTFSLSAVGVLLLIGTTVLIAAGGNVINDCYDVAVDRVNKPSKTIVGDKITEAAAKQFAYVLFGLGLTLGIIVCFLSSHWDLAFIFPASIVLLCVYSRFLKGIVILGNLAIALLAGVTPMLVLWFVFPVTVIAGEHLIEADESGPGGPIFLIFLIYGLFSFMLTLLREIIKDLADVEGDMAVNLKTLPIVAGKAATTIIVWLLCALTVLAIVVIGQLLLQNAVIAHHHIIFIGIGVGIPIIFAAVFSGRKSERRHHVRAGNLIKVAMLAAILFPIYATLVATLNF